MDEQNKNKNPSEFGKVIDALHDKNKLTSLRTYQGDMAEFIKDKNESVISVALKEKERKEEREKKLEQMGEIKLASKPKSGGFKLNLTLVLTSFLLIVLGGAGLYYVFTLLQKEPVAEVVLEESIIPYSNSITLANVTSANFGEEFSKISAQNGISIIKISGPNGESFSKVKDLLDFLEIVPSPRLFRSLQDDYALGAMSQNGEMTRFIVFKVDDFGRAFSGMLEWEEKMPTELEFLNMVKIPMKPDFYAWKDVIVKNKDTRGFVNEKGKSQIAYTFLDKNTILIVDNISSIAEIFSLYASRDVAR